MLQFCVLVLSVCVPAILGQVYYPGQCPEMGVVQDFNVTRYLGLWYENRNYFAIFQAKQECVTATYSLDETNDDVITVLNEGVKQGVPKKANGRAVLVDPSAEEGKLAVSFTNESTDNPEGNYLVLDTDYDSYSVVWSCSNKFPNYNTQFLWILTRKRFPPLKTLNKAYRGIEVRGLDTNTLVVTEQRDCPVVA